MLRLNPVGGRNNFWSNSIAIGLLFIEWSMPTSKNMWS